MNIQTKYHGTVTISDNDIVTFPNGLPGFLDEKRFIIIPLEDSLFCALQSVETNTLAFITVNPFDVYPDYTFKLNQQTKEQLNIDKDTNVSVLAMVTVQDPVTSSTLNLNAPLVINMATNQGKQYIVPKSNYSTKEPLVKGDA